MKKAILLVSFGTTHYDTRKVTIDAIEKKVRETYKDYEVRRAFTAHIIINVLKNRDGIIELTPEEALEKLYKDGYEEVIVQPLHIIPGLEFDYINGVVDQYIEKGYFSKVKVGRPILYFKGHEEDIPDDYSILIESIEKLLNSYENLVLMGHGTTHYSNAAYVCLQQVLMDKGYNKVLIANVEGYPTLEDIIPKLKAKNMNKLTLAPLMVVAGDHAKNDMASDEDDSWKSILEKSGFEVNVHMHGLGEISEFQDIYIEHIKDAIDNRYDNLGKTTKGKNLFA
ncbi:sirohydrochlorin cobaltochelatase [Clostridium amazonitimonense]|uniref:sirohydrochlorin cobaltochelatase n=1 Tax=Clostridium amazonitimonense TaxID=1499689 RepID=UPI0005093CBA|nr:sirohydrochlorin cobaltochelatase [Clostridium amazonitimonense]